MKRLLLNSSRQDAKRDSGCTPVTFLAVATLYTEMVKFASAEGGAPAIESGEQSDERIVQAVLDGNTALFELLMRRYNERLYRTARAITRDDREAEDVMQQAYVNAFANLRQFRGQAQFSTWLTRIAINEALARVRRRGRYEPFEDGPPVRTASCRFDCRPSRAPGVYRRVTRTPRVGDRFAASRRP